MHAQCRTPRRCCLQCRGRSQFDRVGQKPNGAQTHKRKCRNVPAEASLACTVCRAHTTSSASATTFTVQLVVAMSARTQKDRYTLQADVGSIESKRLIVSKNCWPLNMSGHWRLCGAPTAAHSFIPLRIISRGFPHLLTVPAAASPLGTHYALVRAKGLRPVHVILRLKQHCANLPVFAQ